MKKYLIYITIALLLASCMHNKGLVANQETSGQKMSICERKQRQLDTSDAHIFIIMEYDYFVLNPSLDTTYFFSGFVWGKNNITSSDRILTDYDSGVVCRNSIKINSCDLNEDVYKLTNNVLRLQNFIDVLVNRNSGKLFEMEGLAINHFIDSSAFDSIYVIDPVDQARIDDDIDWESSGSYAKYLTSIRIELKKYKPVVLKDLNIKVEKVKREGSGSGQEVYITTTSGELLIKISKKF